MLKQKNFPPLHPDELDFLQENTWQMAEPFALRAGRKKPNLQLTHKNLPTTVTKPTHSEINPKQIPDH